VKTLNQIVAEVESWASSHLQVHSFGQGDIWEISPSSSQFTFPLMWVTVGQSDPREMEMVDQFNVLVCDLVDTGEKNELEVLSDTRQILRDLVAWYRQQHSAAYIVEFQGSITPFTERFAERVSGHALTIRLRQPYDYDSCAIPLGTPLPAPPFCEPATFTLINTATPPATLDSGSIPSGGSDVIVAPAVTVLRDGLPFAVVPSSETVDVPSDCADATVELNGDEVATVASGGTVNIMVEQDGNPVGTFDPNTNSWVIPSCPAGASVSLAISDTTPKVGDTITLTATANFAATNFYFFARQGNDLYQIGENSTGVLNWQADILGTFTVFVQADDNTVGSFNVGGNSVTSTAIIIISDLVLWGDPHFSGIVGVAYPDLSPTGADGTLFNSPTVDTSLIGGHIGLNGINQYARNFGNAATYSFIQNTLQFSIGAWVWSDAATGIQRIMTTGGGTTTRGILLTVRHDLSTFEFIALRGVAGTNYVISTPFTMATGQWYRVDLTCNGIGTGQMYINGVPVTTTITNSSYALPTGNSNNDLIIGARQVLVLDGFWAGRIGPFQIYNSPLSGTGVLNNFDADKSRYGF